MNVILILTILYVILAGFILWQYWKTKTIDDIRIEVYNLFLKAEHLYVNSGSGKQKMKFVVSKARSMLPSWMKLLLTDEFFEHTIQLWFDGIKDLLDDGKINDSGVNNNVEGN